MKKLLFGLAFALFLAHPGHCQVFQTFNSAGIIGGSGKGSATSGGGGGGGDTSVVIASETFDRVPSSGSFLIGSTMTFDNTKLWRSLYGTARNSWSISGSTYNTALGIVIGGTVTFNNNSTQDETVMIGTTTPPINGSSVTWRFVTASSGTTVFGPGQGFDSVLNTGYFTRFNNGSLEFYLSVAAVETAVGGCSCPVPAPSTESSTGTLVTWGMTFNAGQNTFTVDTNNDGTQDCTFNDASIGRPTAPGLVVLRNYFSDIAATRGILEMWVKNPN